MSSLGGIPRKVYNAVFRKTSTFILAVVILSYPFERAFNLGTERYFRYLNRGKLYDEIKGQFAPKDEEEEE